MDGGRVVTAALVPTRLERRLDAPNTADCSPGGRGPTPRRSDLIPCSARLERPTLSRYGAELMGGYRTPVMALLSACVFIALAGCGKTETKSQGAPDVGTTDGMVIEVSVGGGLVTPVVRVADSLPRVWIAGDGRYLQQSSDNYDYPGLIALEERRIPVAALAGLLTDARTAGLLEENPDYGNPRIADAMVTQVVVVTAGKRHAVLIPALGYPNPGLSDQAVAARARLSEFLDTLEHPERIADVSEPSPYSPTALAVYVLNTASASPQAPPATWPLGALGDAGAPTDWPDRSARCLVVTGSDVESVLSAAAGKDRFAPWRAPDGLWNIAIRPLLPDEHSCADVIS